MNATPAGLARFHLAQGGEFGSSHADALQEIRSGCKRSHWIWYVLPQLQGLGHSAMARRYGIVDLQETRAYLADPVLGPRLAEITAAIEAQLLAGVMLEKLLGALDAHKAISSLTLFEQAMEDWVLPEGVSVPWGPQFKGSAQRVLQMAHDQGLHRCGWTEARLGVSGA